MRGNLYVKNFSTSPWGSIPACAGEPLSRGFDSGHYPVYPRVCGGTRCSLVCWLGMYGLSPRVRGNPDTGLVWVEYRGSIPACAGEPAQFTPSRLSHTVYPRVCGGTFAGGVKTVEEKGLSPRVRGNLLRMLPPKIGAGSIPACAGEPAGGRCCYFPEPVYPRVCGGTRHPCASPGAYEGLSPRVRGNPRCTRRGSRRSRSIPACAGEPPVGSSQCRICAVYPRVCGGTIVCPVVRRISPGLSPRVRGNRRRGNR